jgi:hypothetical protein
MKILVRPLLALALAVVLVACTGDDGRSASATNAATTTTVAPPTTGRAYHAKSLIDGMKQVGQPIGKVICYNADNDPNDLLGRPGGYSEKCDWADTRHEQTTPDDLIGGSIEVFDTPGLAMQRAEYLEGFAGSGAFSTGYTWLVPADSNFVLRVDAELTPKQANAYRQAMQHQFD